MERAGIITKLLSSQNTDDINLGYELLDRESYSAYILEYMEEIINERRRLWRPYVKCDDYLLWGFPKVDLKNRRK